MARASCSACLLDWTRRQNSSASLSSSSCCPRPALRRREHTLSLLCFSSFQLSLSRLNSNAAGQSTSEGTRADKTWSGVNNPLECLSVCLSACPFVCLAGGPSRPTIGRSGAHARAFTLALASAGARRGRPSTPLASCCRQRRAHTLPARVRALAMLEFCNDASGAPFRSPPRRHRQTDGRTDGHTHTLSQLAHSLAAAAPLAS